MSSFSKCWVPFAVILFYGESFTIVASCLVRYSQRLVGLAQDMVEICFKMDVYR